MTWSYSGSPGDSNVDTIRFWAQLTNTNDQRLTNEELTYLRTIENTNQEAAAACCEIMATKYAGEADIKAGASGELSIKMSQLSNQFNERAKALRAQSAKLAGPYAASISIAGKEAQEEDTDRVEPAFSRDKFDNEEAGIGSAVQDWTANGPR